MLIIIYLYLYMYVWLKCLQVESHEFVNLVSSKLCDVIHFMSRRGRFYHTFQGSDYWQHTNSWSRAKNSTTM